MLLFRDHQQQDPSNLEISNTFGAQQSAVDQTMPKSNAQKSIIPTNANETCQLSILMVHSPAFYPLAVLFPLLTIATNFFNAILIRKIKAKFFNHPVTNGLLISIASAAIYTNTGGTILVTRSIISMFLSDVNLCYLMEVNNFVCQFWMTPFMSGLVVFNLSIFVLSGERALLARKVGQEVEYNKNAVIDFQVQTRRASKSISPPQGEGSSNWIVPCVTIWIFCTFLSSLRILGVTAEDRQKTLPVCTLQSTSLLMPIFSTTFICICSLSSCGLFFWAGRTSRKQLNDFAVAQAHISLESRVILRYTITITKMLYPTVMFTTVWEAVMGFSFIGFFIFIHGENFGEHQYALLQYYQCLAMGYPPMLFFALMSLYRHVKFDNHGASVFVPLTEFSTGSGRTIKDGESSVRKLKRKIPEKPDKFARFAVQRPAAQTTDKNQPTTSDVKPKREGRKLQNGKNEAEIRFNTLDAIWGVRSSITTTGGSHQRSLAPLTRKMIMKSDKYPTDNNQDKAGNGLKAKQKQRQNNRNGSLRHLNNRLNNNKRRTGAAGEAGVGGGGLETNYDEMSSSFSEARRSVSFALSEENIGGGRRHDLSGGINSSTTTTTITTMVATSSLPPIPKKRVSIVEMPYGGHGGAGVRPPVLSNNSPTKVADRKGTPHSRMSLASIRSSRIGSSRSSRVSRYGGGRPLSSSRKLSKAPSLLPVLSFMEADEHEQQGQGQDDEFDADFNVFEGATGRSAENEHYRTTSFSSATNKNDINKRRSGKRDMLERVGPKTLPDDTLIGQPTNSPVKFISKSSSSKRISAATNGVLSPNIHGGPTDPNTECRPPLKATTSIFTTNRKIRPGSRKVVTKSAWSSKSDLNNVRISSSSFKKVRGRKPPPSAGGGSPSFSKNA